MLTCKTQVNPVLCVCQGLNELTKIISHPTIHTVPFVTYHWVYIQLRRFWHVSQARIMPVWTWWVPMQAPIHVECTILPILMHQWHGDVWQGCVCCPESICCSCWI